MYLHATHDYACTVYVYMYLWNTQSGNLHNVHIAEQFSTYIYNHIAHNYVLLSHGLKAVAFA